MASDSFSALPDIDTDQHDKVVLPKTTSPMPVWFKWSVVAGVIVVVVIIALLLGLFRGVEEEDSVPEGPPLSMTEPASQLTLDESSRLDGPRADATGASGGSPAADTEEPRVLENTQPVQREEMQAFQDALDDIRAEMLQKSVLIDELNARVNDQNSTIESLRAEIAELKRLRAAREARKPKSLPFQVLSIKQLGQSTQVGVVLGDTGRQSLYLGQVLDGWKLVQADVTDRVCVFVHLESEVRQEAYL